MPSPSPPFSHSLVRGVRSHVGSHGRRVVVRAAHAGAAVTEVLLAQSCEALLLRDCVDICADNETDNIEERNPELVGEELLGKGQADGRRDPRNLHDLPEADLDGGPDLVEGTGSSNQRHSNEVNAVLDRSNLRVCQYLYSPYIQFASDMTYNQVADDNLHNLGLQAGAAVEELLQEPNEDVAHGCANQGTKSSHLGNSRSKVMAMLVTVLGQPRSQQLLETSQSTSREHLGAQRVGLKLLDVGSQVALGSSILRATSQCSSDLLSQRVLSTGTRKRAPRGYSTSDVLGCLSECVSLKLD